MANNFACLGLPISDRGSFEKFMEFAAHSGQPQETRFGYYIHWSPGEGVETWVQATLERQLIGCNPHYSGTGRVRARIDKFIAGEHTPLDGSAQGMLIATEAAAEACPFYVDLPAAGVDAPPISPPADVSLQIAAFARDVHCFADQAQLHASKSPYSALASTAFLPAGLSTNQPNTETPQAQAIFSGEIKQYELKTNPLTRVQFHYFQVASFGGTYDVVSDLDTLQGEPTAGGLLAGSFYLSARVAEAGW